MYHIHVLFGIQFDSLLMQRCSCKLIRVLNRVLTLQRLFGYIDISAYYWEQIQTLKNHCLKEIFIWNNRLRCRQNMTISKCMFGLRTYCLRKALMQTSFHAVRKGMAYISKYKMLIFCC